MTYKVHIYLKSFDNLYIHTSLNQIVQIANYLKTFSGCKPSQKVISLPTLKKKFTVLRSPHIDKKSREQFEWTRYKKSIFLDFQKISVFSLFLFLLKNSSFPGVQIEINLKHSTFCKTLPNTFQQYIFYFFFEEQLKTKYLMIYILYIYIFFTKNICVFFLLSTTLYKSSSCFLSTYKKRLCQLLSYPFKIFLVLF